VHSTNIHKFTLLHHYWKISPNSQYQKIGEKEKKKTLIGMKLIAT
jgi:hypothetical protein